MLERWEIRNLSCSLTGELLSPGTRAAREDCAAALGGPDDAFPDSREEDEYGCSQPLSNNCSLLIGGDAAVEEALLEAEERCVPVEEEDKVAEYDEE